MREVILKDLLCSSEKQKERPLPAQHSTDFKVLICVPQPGILRVTGHPWGG